MKDMMERFGRAPELRSFFAAEKGVMQQEFLMRQFPETEQLFATVEERHSQLLVRWGRVVMARMHCNVQPSRSCMSMCGQAGLVCPGAASQICPGAVNQALHVTALLRPMPHPSSGCACPAPSSAAQPRLSNPLAYNIKTGNMEIVPAVDIFLAGFTCVTASKLNGATRGKCISPCRSGEGETGKVAGSRSQGNRPTPSVFGL